VHETFVARDLVELVVDEMQAKACPHWARVAAVRVRIGRLNSVVPAALRSAFDVAKRHTPLHDARLEVELIEPRVWCEACAEEREPAEAVRLRCPVCGARCPVLLRGQELEMAAVELAEDSSSDPAASADPTPAADP
jgi:hydrogenase nickel insertion protein HypA